MGTTQLTRMPEHHHHHHHHGHSPQQQTSPGGTKSVMYSAEHPIRPVMPAIPVLKEAAPTWERKPRGIRATLLVVSSASESPRPSNGPAAFCIESCSTKAIRGLMMLSATSPLIKYRRTRVFGQLRARCQI